MDVSIWKILLYGAFAIFALRSLFSLMQQHKKEHLYLLKKEAKKIRKREAEEKLKEQQQEAVRKLQNQIDQQNQAA